MVIVVALMSLTSGTLTVGKRARTQAQLRALTDGGLQYGYYSFAWNSWGSPYGATLPQT